MTKRGNHRGNFRRGRGGGGRGGGGRGRGGGGRGGNFRGNRNFQESLSEPEVGISAFISTLEGFSGLIKARFSDFHVNEVDMEGNVAKLTNTRIPQEFETVKVDVPTESPIKEISEEKWKAILEMMDNKDDDVSVTIECTDDKETRSLIHKSLKQHFQRKIISNTIEGGEKKVIELKRMSGKNRHQRGEEWPQNVPIYTHFMLFKESIDTMNAIMSISEAIRVNCSAFNYAGVKDRRAKTTQWISVKKVEPAKLVFRTKRLRNIKIGNITFKDNPLKLGQLSGNRFRIALRNVSADDDVIENHVQHLKKHGFINYYGLQRFGNDKDVPTHQIGVTLLQGNFKEACNLILKPRKYDNPLMELTQAKKVYHETQNAEEAAKKLSTQVSIESKLLFGLANSGKNDFVTALESIPRNMRLMYIHAFQSLVWNLVVTKRIQDFGLEPIVGDLVYITEDDDLDTEIMLDDTKGIKEEQPDDQETNENAEDKETEKEVDEDKKLIVKILTETDLDKYTIYDVVLPLPGYNIQYPENSLKDYYKEILGKYNLELEMPMQKVRCYTLCGNYRKLLQIPQDLTWRTLKYNGPHDTLIRSDFEEILKHKEPESKPDGQYKGLVLDFKLKSSSYATMVLREVLKIDTSVQTQTNMNNYHEKNSTSESAKPEDEPLPEGSLMDDKDKFAAFKKLIEESPDNDVCQPIKRPIEDEDTCNSKKQKLDEDKEDEGIKIQPSLV